MKKTFILFVCGALFFLNDLQPLIAQHSRLTFRIAFGSCSRHELPQTLWKSVQEVNPDVWIWLGDIVYGDTEDMNLLREKYNIQKNNPDYQKIRQNTKIIGIWDDHDYGLNDGGKEYPKKAESEQVLWDFLDVKADSPLRKQEGVYSSHTYHFHQYEIKVILLDGRYFRDTLQRVDGVYLPNPNGEILGEAQWQWLEKELRESKADIHIIGSGIQVLSEEHPYEKWANFPKERKRLLDLLAKTEAKNTILISGDRHIGEISKLVDHRFKAPLYDITSSGLTHTWDKYSEEANKYRVGDLAVHFNFGLLEITVTRQRPIVEASILGEEHQVYLKQEIEIK